MSAVDDILGGLDFDSVDGTSRLPFLTPGKYVLGVRKVFIGNGYKGARFSVEFEVLESSKSLEDDAPLAKGTQCSWIQKLGGTSKAAMVGPNNVVGFLSAATGYSSSFFKATKEDPSSGKKRIKQIVGDENGTMPEGPLVQLGVRVSGTCYTTKSGAGNTITPVNFSIVPGYTLKDLMLAKKQEQAAPSSAPF